MNDISLEDYFEGQRVIPTVAASEFIRLTHPDISDSTARGYVAALVDQGKLKRVGKGKYVLGASKDYSPNLSVEYMDFNRLLKKNFPFLDICIWHTSQLNEFIQHQLVKHLLLIEVEQETVDSVFEFVKDAGYSALSDPSLDILEKYMASEGDTYIIKPLVSESPLLKVDAALTASLEKMLVDVFCDKSIFNSIQGAEMIALFENALDKYTINMDRLFRYAGRRGKKSEMEQYIEKIESNKR